MDGGPVVSGIRSGTRLEQLEALRRRLDHEIAHERAQAAADGGRLVECHPVRLVVSSRKNTTDLRLEQLGVTAHDVKVWGVQAGLLDEVKRGRVALSLVEQYALAQEATEWLTGSLRFGPGEYEHSAHASTAEVDL